jgi:hypothetical protein
MVDPRFRFEHCLAKAAEAMECARNARDDDISETYLVAAQSWAMLAREAEKLERREQE